MFVCARTHASIDTHVYAYASLNMLAMACSHDIYAHAIID